MWLDLVRSCHSPINFFKICVVMFRSFFFFFVMFSGRWFLEILEEKVEKLDLSKPVMSVTTNTYIHTRLMTVTTNLRQTVQFW